MATSSRWYKDAYTRDSEELLANYLQSISIPYQMEWSLTKDQDGVLVGNFGSQDPYEDGSSRYLTSLLPGRVTKDFPLGEPPKLTSTFLSDFLKFKR